MLKPSIGTLLEYELQKNPIEAQIIFSHLRKNLDRDPSLKKT